MGGRRVRPGRHHRRSAQGHGPRRTSALRERRHAGPGVMARPDAAGRPNRAPDDQRSLLEARGMTAAEIVDRIKQSLASNGVTWRAETVDTFKAGKPETPVSGIATTFMATFDAIQRSVAAGANFVITHEPTFYNHQDTTTSLADDAVFKAKMAFIEKNQVVVFRFHDHWHAKRPDGMRVALFRLFGWADAPGTVTLPPTTLGELAADLRKRLDIRAMRVV